MDTERGFLDLIRPEWKRDFCAFVESGEASEEFLAYRAQDASCQDALQRVFDQGCTLFERFANEIRSEM